MYKKFKLFNKPQLIVNTRRGKICINIVATLRLEEWEDDTHTLELGTCESTGTPEILEFNCKGQNTSH